jgi:hypothetical protein
MFHDDAVGRLPKIFLANPTSDDSTTVSYPHRGQQIVSHFFFNGHPPQRVLAVM